MIYPIPEYLQDTHDGDEWAIAAIVGGRAVALRYLIDIAPDVVRQNGLSASTLIRLWAERDPVELRELQVLGNVYSGIVTAVGFEERWRLADWKPNDQLPEGAEPL